LRHRRVDWTLVFPQGAKVQSAAYEIESAHLDVASHLETRRAETLLVASKVAVLNVGLMLSHNAMMRAIATKNGGSFDGWDASIEDLSEIP